MIDESASGIGVQRSLYSTKAVDLKAKSCGRPSVFSLRYSPCSIGFRAYLDETEAITKHPLIPYSIASFISSPTVIPKYHALKMLEYSNSCLPTHNSHIGTPLRRLLNTHDDAAAAVVGVVVGADR